MIRTALFFGMIAAGLAFCAVPPAAVPVVDPPAAIEAETGETLLIPGSFSRLFQDKLDQPYTLDRRGRLVKYDAAGRFLFDYANTILGAPTIVDVTNPLQLVLFYEDYQTVVLLDRTLSEITTLDLRAIPDLQRVTTAGRAYNDQLWVYDGWDRRLKLLDVGGRIQRRSDELQLLLQLSAPPRAILADETRVYLAYPGHGVALFNNLAQFQGWLEWPSLRELGYARGRYYLRDAEGFRAWTYDRQPSEARFGAWSQVVPTGAGYLRIGPEGVWWGARAEE